MAQILSDKQARFLMDNGLRRVVRKDPAASHQIVLLLSGGRIGVTCNCMRTKGDGWSLANSQYDLIDVRSSWPPGAAVSRWREHLQ